MTKLSWLCSQFQKTHIWVFAQIYPWSFLSMKWNLLFKIDKWSSTLCVLVKLQVVSLISKWCSKFISSLVSSSDVPCSFKAIDDRGGVVKGVKNHWQWGRMEAITKGERRKDARLNIRRGSNLMNKWSTRVREKPHGLCLLYAFSCA